MTNHISLEVKNLRKEYGNIVAVDNISFHVDRGEIVGLLGPNGAGKTTTISMLLSILEPTSGTIEILGKNIRDNRSETLSHMNFSATYAQMPGNLTVMQNLKIFAMLYAIPDRKATIERLISEFDITKFRNTKVGILSSGEQTRVNLAKALLNTPSLLLLDEPTAFLDPSIARLMRDKIKEYMKKENAAVLWTSHNMHEIEAVCDRVLFLSHGKILVEGKPSELPKQYNKKNLEELFIAVAREPLELT